MPRLDSERVTSEMNRLLEDAGASRAANDQQSVEEALREAITQRREIIKGNSSAGSGDDMAYLDAASREAMGYIDVQVKAEGYLEDAAARGEKFQRSVTGTGPTAAETVLDDAKASQQGMAAISVEVGSTVRAYEEKFGKDNLVVAAESEALNVAKEVVGIVAEVHKSRGEEAGSWADTAKDVGAMLRAAKEAAAPARAAQNSQGAGGQNPEPSGQASSKPRTGAHR